MLEMAAIAGTSPRNVDCPSAAIRQNKKTPNDSSSSGVALLAILAISGPHRISLAGAIWSSDVGCDCTVEFLGHSLVANGRPPVTK
jgi:hypothetical protein